MEVSKWVLAMEVGRGTAMVMEDDDEDQDGEAMEYDEGRRRCVVRVEQIMGSSETNKLKEPKTASAQEQSSSTPTGTTNPDWSGFQAYSPMPPPGFLASSPQAHPYMWGVQHIMPPYGMTPHPYVAVYPHGGIYAHPFIPPGNTLSSMETDGKLSEGREKLPIKRFKKSLSSSNTVSGKNNGPGKTSGALANGVCSRSAESASEHSSEGSDADSQNVAEASQDSGAIYGSQNGRPNTSPTMVNHTMAIMPPCVPGPTTNLNIECDELALRTEALNEENATLRTELSHIRSEYEQLLSENASLKVRRDLGRFLGKKILGLVGISIQLAYGYASRALAEWSLMAFRVLIRYQTLRSTLVVMELVIYALPLTLLLKTVIGMREHNGRETMRLSWQNKLCIR
ncbi:hypothetical protein RHMOL_Rhmol11G0073600 [Rhododendron molle]|uniref:Uncharacterized protein n=1 Tax=Rhododendron molle TaxID=49168 RepID=A0ACC0LQJ3_RHOML|nr:hypothetical protein RHMOL_Rhmol11G0073600 [Rhododendron molle]